MLTNSPPHGLLGRQEPRVRSLPPGRVGSRIDDFRDITDLAGLTNDPWQDGALEAIASVDADGQWAAREFGLLVSRQQGKGNILLVYELTHALLWPRPDGMPKWILHTAHEGDTARGAWRRLKNVLLRSPVLRAQLKGGGRESSQGISGVMAGSGSLGFEFQDGTIIEFRTRTGNAGVGKSPDVLIIDEAQNTPLTIIEALTPTVLASPAPQILFTGTVPKEDQDGTYFEGLRDRGRAGGVERVGWIEHTPDGSDDPVTAAAINMGDIEVWRQGSPGLGYRVKLEDIADAWERFRVESPDAFARQYLSIWPNRAEDAVESVNDLDMQRWADGLVSERVSVGRPLVLAVALGRGGGYSSIAAAQRSAEGEILLEHLDTRAQSLWVPAALAERKRELGATSIVLDARNAEPILTDLSVAGVRYLGMSMSEVAAAFDLMIEHVNAGDVVHPDQPEVAIALQNAVPRVMSKTGNLRTWDQGDPSEPVTVVQAMTWALWGLKKLEGRRESAPPAEVQVLANDDPLPIGAGDVLTMRF